MLAPVFPSLPDTPSCYPQRRNCSPLSLDTVGPRLSHLLSPLPSPINPPPHGGFPLTPTFSPSVLQGPFHPELPNLAFASPESKELSRMDRFLKQDLPNFEGTCGTKHAACSLMIMRPVLAIRLWPSPRCIQSTKEGSKRWRQSL